MSYYDQLAQRVLSGEILGDQECYDILTNQEIRILPLLDAAYQVRSHYWKNEVHIHILNNVQNGHCSEDCNYCAQRKGSTTPIENYPMKSEELILQEAKTAYESGAFRYCMVFSGKGPSLARTKKIADLVKKIKENYPIEVCVSAGLMQEEHTAILKEAGLDRLNHNLNTSPRNYKTICSTHSYEERLGTLLSAKKVGLEVCSGLIVGLGDSHEELVKLGKTLRELEVKSMPINFFLPVEGHEVANEHPLTPLYCLRMLALFRFLNPSAELRAAAGREYHFRKLEVLALYPANSLFLEGYLNIEGNSARETLQMIKDAGFTIASDFKEELLEAKPSLVLKQHQTQTTKERSGCHPHS